jgi:hypothetical protein
MSVACDIAGLVALLVIVLEASYGRILLGAQNTIGLLQRQYSAVTGDITTCESGLDPAAFTGWKVNRLLETFCHGQSPVRIQRKRLNRIEPHGLCPSYLALNLL